ncbi:MAG: rRNA maturation RNase YbeY [Oscillospiraceae bacterium]|nr:rRNA maturation RNase YbeY [Oscillospiraceae bacterium]
MVKVYIQNKQKKLKLPTGLRLLIKKSCAAAAVYEKTPFKAEISVTLVDDKEIQQLNKRYRQKDIPTDVLSFPMFEKENLPVIPTDEEIPLGDIVISIETAIHQAQIFNHSFEREIAFLTVHSMLHLLGYDHETSKRDENEMFRKQEEILGLLGIKRDFA